MLFSQYSTALFSTLLLLSLPMSSLRAMKINSPTYRQNTTPTPLHLAAKEGDSDKINLLLDSGADVNSTECDFNNTPLHIATWFGHAHCIPLLIKRGAKLDIPNCYGSTPVHSAAWKNETLCLKELIKHDAHYYKENSTGIGNTPLYLAAEAGSTECLTLLLELTNNNKEHIDRECAGDNSTALQAAAGRFKAQCYWDLVVAGADYTKKMCYEDSFESNSESIYGNNPLKNFIQTIELSGKGNPPRFHLKDYNYCLLCKKNFEHNNVIVTIKQCYETFHADCFDNYCIRYFMKNNPNCPRMIELKKNHSSKEIEHIIKTCPLGNVDLADTCPTCNINFNPQHSLELSVFLQ